MREAGGGRGGGLADEVDALEAVEFAQHGDLLRLGAVDAEALEVRGDRAPRGRQPPGVVDEDGHRVGGAHAVDDGQFFVCPGVHDAVKALPLIPAVEIVDCESFDGYGVSRGQAAAKVALQVDGLFSGFAHPRIPVEFEIFQFLRRSEENGDVVGRREGIDVVTNECGEIREWRHDGCRPWYSSGWKSEDERSQGRLLDEALVDGMEGLGVQLPTARISSGSTAHGKAKRTQRL